MDKDALFDRIRGALGGERTPLPELDEALFRLVGPDEDLVALFVERAEAVGMTVHREKTLPELLGELGCERVTVNGEVQVEGAVDWRAEPGLAAHYDGVDAGVTDVAAAIAETGTLVVRSGPEHSRGTYLVPPIHVAVVRPDQIVADLVDFCGQPADDAALTTLVTGPSKTADIEGILVRGVHGPREVHILLLEP